VRELLARLRSNLQRLENFRKMSPSMIDGWSLRYGFYDCLDDLYRFLEVVEGYF